MRYLVQDPAADFSWFWMGTRGNDPIPSAYKRVTCVTVIVSSISFVPALRIKISPSRGAGYDAGISPALTVKVFVPLP